MSPRPTLRGLTWAGPDWRPPETDQALPPLPPPPPHHRPSPPPARPRFCHRPLPPSAGLGPSPAPRLTYPHPPHARPRASRRPDPTSRRSAPDPGLDDLSADAVFSDGQGGRRAEAAEAGGGGGRAERRGGGRRRASDVARLVPSPPGGLYVYSRTTCRRARLQGAFELARKELRSEG